MPGERRGFICFIGKIDRRDGWRIVAELLRQEIAKDCLFIVGSQFLRTGSNRQKGTNRRHRLTSPSPIRAERLSARTRIDDQQNYLVILQGLIAPRSH